MATIQVRAMYRTTLTRILVATTVVGVLLTYWPVGPLIAYYWRASRGETSYSWSSLFDGTSTLTGMPSLLGGFADRGEWIIASAPILIAGIVILMVLVAILWWYGRRTSDRAYIDKLHQ